MYRAAVRLLRWTVCVLLVGLVGASALGYAEDVMDLSSVRFHNNWGDIPEEEWRALLDHYVAGNLEEAVSLLEWMESTGEFDLALVLRNRALILKELGDMARALDDLTCLSALTGEPEDLLLLGWSLYQTGRFQEAIETLLPVREALADDPWSHYVLARAWQATGRYDEAVAAFEAALGVDERFAPAYYHMGLLKRELGDSPGALAALTRAISLDPSYTELYEPLAQLNEEAGNIERAWRYYRGAALRYPTDPEPQAAVLRLAEEYGDMLRDIERAENAERLAAARHRTVQPIADRSGIPLVRVGLAEGQAQVRISAGGPFIMLAEDVQAVARGEGERIYTAIASGSGLRILDADGNKVAEVQGALRLQQVDDSQTFILYDMVFGQGYFFATIEHRQYRGSLELLPRPSGLTVVNEVNLEEYLYSVVPSEMYATMPMEALKVQAMAARTYTLRNMGRYRSRGFDVLGSVASSEYRGVDREHPNSTAAVDATRGLVLLYGNQLVDAVYSAEHGGHSAAAEEVWGGAHAYLPGRFDGGEGGPEFPLLPSALFGWLTGIPETYASTAGFGLRSTFRWVQPMPAARLQAIVDARADIGRIRAIVPRGRALSGHVSTVEFVGTHGIYRVSSDRIRSTLGGIKSNLFRIEAIYGEDGFPVEFLIIGGGSGHGVGMSQIGAAGRALAGQTAEEIIAHYYPNVRVARRY